MTKRILLRKSWDVMVTAFREKIGYDLPDTQTEYFLHGEPFLFGYVEGQGLLVVGDACARATGKADAIGHEVIVTGVVEDFDRFCVYVAMFHEPD